MQRTKTSRICQLVGNALQSGINSMVGFVKSLQNKEGISKAEFESCSDTMKTMMSKLVNLFQYDNPKAKKPLSDGTMPQFFGVKALDALYTSCETITKKKGVLAYDHVGACRICDFALTPAQKLKTNTWLQQFFDIANVQTWCYEGINPR